MTIDKDFINTLDADMRYYYEERAAIREHDGMLSREEAERLAYKDLTDHIEAQRLLGDSF